MPFASVRKEKKKTDPHKKQEVACTTQEGEEG